MGIPHSWVQSLQGHQVSPPNTTALRIKTPNCAVRDTLKPKPTLLISSNPFDKALLRVTVLEGCLLPSSWQYYLVEHMQNQDDEENLQRRATVGIWTIWKANLCICPHRSCAYTLLFLHHITEIQKRNSSGCMVQKHGKTPRLQNEKTAWERVCFLVKHITPALKNNILYSLKLL